MRKLFTFFSVLLATITLFANGYVSPISVTDGTATDWDALPAEYVASATHTEGCSYDGLKSVKVYCDDNYLNILVEVNLDVVTDLLWTPFRIFLNADGSADTGGYGDLFADADTEWMLETAIYEYDYVNPYNPAVFNWWGEVGGNGWQWTDPEVEITSENCWGAIVCEGSYPAVGTSQMVDGDLSKVEIQILKELIPAQWADEFTIGFEIQQKWTSCGILPNAADDKLGNSVRAEKLKVKVYHPSTIDTPTQPQDSTIYHPTEDATICEGETYIWMGMPYTEVGTYTYEEIVEDENYIYHYIHTLELQVIAPPEPDTIVVEAYDSYEWHGVVYTESGTYIYEEHCYQEILQLTIIDTPTPSEPQDTTIYHPTEYVVICEGDVFNWRGWLITEAGTHTGHETVKDENYTYHHIYTLELTVIPFSSDTIVVEAYDSYEWHGEVYTESGVYTYEEWCYQEILELTIIPSEDKESVYEHHNYLVCDAYIFVDPITGSPHVISSLIPFSLTWSDTIIGTNIDTIHTFNITPIVYPEPLTEDMLYAIGAVPKLVAGEKVDIAGTTELIMAYYQMHDQHDIADVIGVEWVAGHDVVLDAEQTTHTMVLEVWDECDDIIPMEFTFPVSKKDSEPQDTTIYIYHTEDVTICEGETLIWMGMEYTEEGIYTYEEIVVEDDYIYHYIYTLHLMVLPPTLDMYEVTAYDSYEWHGVVYTESGVYTYSDPYNPCVIEELHLTIIDTPTPPEPQDTTIYHPTEYATICEGETLTWRGMEYTEAGTHIYEEIVEEDDYIYIYIFTLDLTVIAPMILVWPVEAYDSYEWHGEVYTESGVYFYEEYCYQEILELTIIPSTETAVDNMQTDSDHSAQKILRDQQILILRDGKIYSIMGQEM